MSVSQPIKVYAEAGGSGSMTAYANLNVGPAYAGTGVVAMWPSGRKTTGTIKAGTSFTYDNVATIISPGERGEDHVHVVVRTPKGWVCTTSSGPGAPQGKQNVYAGYNPDAAEYWKKMHPPTGGGTPAPAPFSGPVADGSEADEGPGTTTILLAAGAAIAAYYFLSKRK